ncbi:MAG: ABC transporter permease [Acidobacteriota bacterium]|nr:MAG: ABC transporter permease [Acidobacteriota bacterium]
MIPVKYNVKNLFARKQSTLMTIGGLALVVMVFVIMMALAHGFASTMRGTGDSLNLMVLRQGAQTETTSYVSDEQADIIETLRGIARGEKGEPLASRELLVFIHQLKRGAKTDSEGSNLAVRGVTERAFAVHPEVRIVAGRMFSPGKLEMLASRRIAERFQGCALGETLRMGTYDWSVVGIIEAEGSAYGSELWTDLTLLQEIFYYGAYSSIVVVRAEDESSSGALREIISETDTRLKLSVMSQPEYYEKQTTATSQEFFRLGLLVSIFMCVGAVFGAMNTMYAAVSARRREIGTLRALGFKRRHILVSFLLESVALSLVGGALGLLLALPVHGYSTGTTNWQTFVEVAFAFRISPRIMLAGIGFAALMGFLGGLLPAWNACRTPVTDSLRSV